MNLDIEYALDPGRLFYDFYYTWGSKVMQDSYGIVTPLRFSPERRVWRSRGQDIGWVSVMRLPNVELGYEVSLGIFPDFSHQGWRFEFLDHVVRWATERGAKQLNQVILNTNTGYLERLHKEAQGGSPWKWAGETWYPTPMTTFTRMLP